MAARFLDEFSVGDVFETAPVTLSEAQTVAFAKRYDPQGIHIDPVRAKASPYGGLIASGHQTIGVAFAQFIRLGLFAGNSLGGPAMDEVRWMAPVRPGDTLHTRVEVLEVRPSASKPDRGVIRLQFTTAVGGRDVAAFKTTTFLRRAPGAAAGAAS